MLISRRYLPPMPWLTAFESVARLGSVTEAAQELDLTQGAVSRQIQKLEDLLNTRLFQRDKRRLMVTPAGRAYAAELREAIAAIANATVSVTANPDGGVLDLAMLPAFGTHWVVPLLPAFLRDHPGVTVNLSTRIVPFDFGHEPFHAAIHFGQDNWPRTRALKLMDEELVPVVSPDLCPADALSPERLANLPLLQIGTRVGNWARWFQLRGIDAGAAGGIAFDQFASMQKAAIVGAGAALMPRYLVETDLVEGRLITLAGASMTGVGAYYLVWPDRFDDHPPVVAFRDWIAARFAASERTQMV